MWQGEYQGISRQWLRWLDEQGNWVLTETEQEHQRAEQAVLQLQQVVLNLLQSGMSEGQVAMLTGLPEQRVQLINECEEFP